jgi:hypothetical protein
LSADAASYVHGVDLQPSSRLIANGDVHVARRRRLLVERIQAHDERVCLRGTDGKAADLQQELEALFERQNRSEAKGATSIPATFLRVTVAR